MAFPSPLRLLTDFTRFAARRINLRFVLALLIIIVILKRNAAMWEINPPVPLVKRRFSSSRQHVVVGRVLHPPYFNGGCGGLIFGIMPIRGGPDGLMQEPKI